MITVKKLMTLKDSTRLRKYIKIFHGFEVQLRSCGTADLQLCSDFVEACLKEDYSSDINSKCLSTAQQLHSEVLHPEHLLRSLNSLRHSLGLIAGKTPADWDLDETDNSSSQLDLSCCGARRVFCEDIRSPFNIGSILRTSEVFGFAEVMLTPDCPDLSHPRVKRTAMGTDEYLANQRISTEDFINLGEEKRGKLFVLETGGEMIDSFKFPENGTVVLGSEELGVSPQLLEAADREGGRVSIPVLGRKASMNVSVAFGILASWWVLKK